MLLPSAHGILEHQVTVICLELVTCSCLKNLKIDHFTQNL